MWRSGHFLRVGLALLASLQGFTLHADSPGPDFDLSSKLAQLLGPQGKYDMSELKQKGCESDLGRIRGTEIGTPEAPLTIGAAASLVLVTTKVRVNGQILLLDHLETIRTRLSSRAAIDYNALKTEVSQVRQSLESHAAQLRVAEVRELASAYGELESLLARAQLEEAGSFAAHSSIGYTTPVQGPAQTIAATIKTIQSKLEAIAALVTRAQTAVLGSVLTLAGTQARARALEGPKARGGGRLNMNSLLALALLLPEIIDGLMPDETRSQIRAWAGNRLAQSWKGQPDAVDAYVLGGPLTQVCERAVRDPKGFGLVVGEKMAVIETWRALREFEEASRDLLAQSAPGESVSSATQKRLGGSGDLIFAELPESVRGEKAL